MYGNYLNFFFIVILGILRDKENEADTATESGVQQSYLNVHFHITPPDNFESL